MSIYEKNVYWMGTFASVRLIPAQILAPVSPPLSNRETVNPNPTVDGMKTLNHQSCHTLNIKKTNFNSEFHLNRLAYPTFSI